MWKLVWICVLFRFGFKIGVLKRSDLRKMLEEIDGVFIFGN